MKKGHQTIKNSSVHGACEAHKQLVQVMVATEARAQAIQDNQQQLPEHARLESDKLEATHCPPQVRTAKHCL